MRKLLGLLSDPKTGKIYTSPQTRIVSEKPTSTQNSRVLRLDNANDVDWIKTQQNPELWHVAAISALVWHGDPHGFLEWLIQQPALDRATAGWLFMWPDGSSYLRGEDESHFLLDMFDGKDVLKIFSAVCERSQKVGFKNDRIGLESEWETVRLACLKVVQENKVAAGINAPMALIEKPYPAQKRNLSFYHVGGGELMYR